MPPGPSAVVRKLEQYAEKGSSKALANLIAICRTFANANGVIDTVIDVNTLMRFISRVSKGILLHRPNYDAWDGIVLVTTSRFYSGASQVVKELPNYPQNVYDVLLQCAAAVLNDGSDDIEVSGCLKFLANLLNCRLVHQRRIGNFDGLRTPLWRYFGRCFRSTDDDNRWGLLTIAGGLVECDGKSDYDHDRCAHLWSVIQEGALPIP